MTSAPRFHLGAALTRLALTGIFLSVPRFFIRIAANQLDRDAGAPRTIYAMNHKRDPDTFLAPVTLLTHRGWRALTADVRFVMRADAFQPGFLSRITPRPWWLKRLLRPFSVGEVLRWAGVYPIDGFHSRPAELWIREVVAEEGNKVVGDLLTPESREAVARAAGVSVAALDTSDATALTKWRYAAALQSPTGPGVLAGSARRRATRRMMDTARSELSAITAWLRAGGSLLLAPEGRLSPDGMLSPARAGLRLLTRDVSPDARIQPIAITYDFMAPGRLQMRIELAEPIINPAALSGNQLDWQVRAAWLGAARMPCTQLATAALTHWRAQTPAEKPVTGMVDDLAREVVDLARRLDAAGRRVDLDLLNTAGARRRVRGYLRYASRHGLIRRHGASFVASPGALAERDDAPATLPGVPPDGVGYDLYPMRYAWNEAFEELSDAGLLGIVTHTSIATATPFIADAGRS